MGVSFFEGTFVSSRKGDSLMEATHFGKTPPATLTIVYDKASNPRDIFSDPSVKWTPTTLRVFLREAFPVRFEGTPFPL